MLGLTQLCMNHQKSFIGANNITIKKIKNNSVPVTTKEWRKKQNKY